MPKLTPKSQLDSPSDTVRLDKWLWAARFFKTRSLAQQAIEKGRVLLSGERTKLARLVRPGDELTLQIGEARQVVTVLALSDVRGPAPVARTLYAETEASIKAREEQRAARRLSPEPALSIEGGRPTKRDRRMLVRLGGG
jgi:ribosome-associated heat shock protein Hsp15